MSDAEDPFNRHPREAGGNNPDARTRAQLHAQNLIDDYRDWTGMLERMTEQYDYLSDTRPGEQVDTADLAEALLSGLTVLDDCERQALIFATKVKRLRKWIADRGKHQ